MATTDKGDPREPQISFTHARLKVQWAEQHVELATRMVNWFVCEQKKAGLLHKDPQSGEISIGGQIIPAGIPLAAGDAIFSLRSALDCCWMGLKRAIDADSPKLTLPRAKTREKLKTAIEKASVEHAFNGADALILDKVRPYAEGNETLWLAAQLDNWNKHNMLIASAQSNRINRVTITHANGSISVIEGCQLVGPKIMSLGVGDPTDFTLEGDADTTIDVVLQHRETGHEWLVVPFLVTLLKDTHEAVELFASLAPRS